MKVDPQAYRQHDDDKSPVDLEQNLVNRNLSSTVILDELTKVKKRSSSLRLLGYTYKHLGLLILANVGLLVTSLSLVVIPYLTGKIIDSISNEENGKDDLNHYSYQFIFVFLMAAIFGFLRGTLYSIIGQRVVIDLRNELFNSLLNKDIEFFDQNRSGELISRLTSDISLVQEAASDNISILIRNFVQFVGSLILLFILTWQLTLILLTVVPPMAMITMIFIKFFKKYTKEYQDLVAKSTQVAVEALGNMRVVRSFSTEDEETQQFIQQTSLTYGVGRKRGILYGIFTFFVTIFGYGVILLVLWYGGNLVQNGTITIGALTSFVMYTLTLTVSLISMGGTINTMVTASTVSEKIFALIDHQVKIKNGNLVINPKAFHGAITFDKVTFSYPSKTDVDVLKDLSLEIKAGEVVAFVGQSGSGKSTIVALLERFYDATSGQITIDGERIQDYEIKKLHQAIGFVSQEPTLFSGTLEENIAYGVKNYTEQDIDNAMKMAHAYEFVRNKKSFPDGLKTIVGERGIKLSGGQKQRIAIARALIKDPKILIFDEATSALDADSEFQVQTAIDELVLTGKKTIIIIAHRLSTIMNCHKIVVLQNGCIKEVGSHNELVRFNGVYRQLIDKQLSSQDKENELL